MVNARAEIEHIRRQIHRQRREIRDLQRAGIPTVSAEELLARMLNKVDDLCAERGRLVGEGRRKYPGHKQSHQGTDRAAFPVTGGSTIAFAMARAQQLAEKMARVLTNEDISDATIAVALLTSGLVHRHTDDAGKAHQLLEGIRRLEDRFFAKALDFENLKLQ